MRVIADNSRVIIMIATKNITAQLKVQFFVHIYVNVRFICITNIQ